MNRREVADLIRMAREGDLVTTQEAAKRLGLSERAIRKWVDRGSVQPIGDTKPYLFVWQHMSEFAALNRHPRNAGRRAPSERQPEVVPFALSEATHARTTG